MGSALIFSPLCSFHSDRHGDMLLNELPLKVMLDLFVVQKVFSFSACSFAVFFKHSLALSIFVFLLLFLLLLGKRNGQTQLLSFNASLLCPGITLVYFVRVCHFHKKQVTTSSTRTCASMLIGVFKNHNFISFIYSLSI